FIVGNSAGRNCQNGTALVRNSSAGARVNGTVDAYASVRGNSAVGDRHGSTSEVGNAAAATARGVVRNGAVCNCQAANVSDAATAAIGTLIPRGVVANLAMSDCQRARVKNGAAILALGSVTL